MRRSTRIWAAKEQYRVLAVAMAAVVVFAIVGFVAERRIDRTEDDIVVTADRYLPTRRALVDVERALRASQFEFTQLLTEPDPVRRVLAVEDVRQTLSQAEKAWTDYRELSPAEPGEPGTGVPCADGVDEAELQAEFETLKAEQDTLTGPVGLALVSPDEYTVEEILTGASFIALRQVQEGQRAIVQQLQDDCYDPLVAGNVDQALRDLHEGRREVRALLVVAGVLGLLVFLVSFRSAVVHENDQAQVAAERARQARRNELEARLQRALNMSQTEDDALEIVRGALSQSVPDLPVELLLADSSDAHFQQVLSTDPVHRGPGCPVVSPMECPAAQGTETKVFPTSEALDACPHLRTRATDCSAVCVPINIAGRAVGVLHTVAADGEPPDDESIDTLELVGDRLGNRLSLIRAMAERETQARSDPLTGLLNRRSLENNVRPMVERGLPYVVAYGDLDHFKKLNDTHGHETGDRALRLFARALRDAVRPNDLACRYGGEEFLVVIPEVSLTEAADVVERVRVALTRALEPGTTPPFTVSFGLADSTQADDFRGVVALADRALLEAKAAGRDRVLLAGDPSVVVSGPVAGTPPLAEPPDED
jgi:diguanylate cyclase (GGDEF)-like protein